LRRTFFELKQQALILQQKRFLFSLWAKPKSCKQQNKQKKKGVVAFRFVSSFFHFGTNFFMTRKQKTGLLIFNPYTKKNRSNQQKQRILKQKKDKAEQ
jgi:hypothetical protein